MMAIQAPARTMRSDTIGMMSPPSGASDAGRLVAGLWLLERDFVGLEYLHVQTSALVSLRAGDRAGADPDCTWSSGVHVADFPMFQTHFDLTTYLSSNAWH